MEPYSAGMRKKCKLFWRSESVRARYAAADGPAGTANGRRIRAALPTELARDLRTAFFADE